MIPALFRTSFARSPRRSGLFTNSNRALVSRHFHVCSRVSDKSDAELFGVEDIFSRPSRERSSPPRGNYGNSSRDSRSGYGDNFGRSTEAPSRRPISDNWASLSAALNSKPRGPMEFVKPGYEPHPDVHAMSKEEIEQWRENADFRVSGDAPAPIRDFEHTTFPDNIVSHLKKKFTEPSPIQAQAWPIAMSGNDMIGRAETGSGKTLSFILPGIKHALAQVPKKSFTAEPNVVVIAPTRELALQINDEANEFCRLLRLRTAVVHGGQGTRHRQLSMLSNKPHFVIATPGRLLDFLNEGVLSFDSVSQFVLDEADRMLDMGFEDQIRAIFKQTSPNRQTLMFSATWPKAVDRLAREFLKKPSTIVVGDGELKANKNVRQYVQVLQPADKLEALIHLLEDNPDNKMLIFAGNKANCDRIGNALFSHFDGKLKFAVIHGDKSQPQREAIVQDFRDGVLKAVVATDVASRGLDVKDIDIVVNFEMAQSVEDYVHRIGRTGRAGKSGNSITYFTPLDYKVAAPLIAVLKDAGQEVPPELHKLVPANTGRRDGGRGRHGGGKYGGGGRGRGGFNSGGGRNAYGDNW